MVGLVAQELMSDVVVESAFVSRGKLTTRVDGYSRIYIP